MRRSPRPHRLKSRLVASCRFGRYLASVAGLGFCVGLALSPAQANGVCGTATANGNGGTDFVVSGAVTHTCTIDANDTMNITSTGSIVSNASHALVNLGGATSILNDGLLSDSDAGARAFANSGLLGTFINTGTISASLGAVAVSNISTITLFDNDGGLITSSSALLATILNSGTLTLTNNGGTISHTGTGEAIDSSGTLHLDNTNGLIQSLDRDAVISAGGTINNTGGMISAGDASAIYLTGGLSAPIVNTGGTIKSTSTDEAEGAFHIDADVGNLTVTGGTILNNNTSEDDVSAVSIDADQTGMITFDGVNIIADGTGIGQGFAILVYERDASITLTSTTSVRGTIAQYSSSNMINLITSGTILGNITGAHENDSVTVNGGSVTGTIFLEEGDDTVTLNGGTVNGLVDLEDDNDTFILNGGTMNGNVVLEDQNDTFTYISGMLNGNVNFGRGLNTFNVNGVFETGGRQFITDATGSTNLIVGPTGDFTINDTIDLRLGSIEVQEDGRLYLNGGDLGGTHFTNAGTTQIGLDRTLTIGVFDNVTPGTLVFNTAGVSNLMKTGKIDAFESHSDLSNQVVQVNYVGGALTLDDRSLIMAGSNTAVLPSAPVTDNSFLYNFGVEVDAGDPNDIYLVVTDVKTIEEVASSPTNAKVGNVLVNELGGTENPEIGQIQANLGTASTQEEFNEVLESTTPPVDQGNQTAAVGMTGAMFDLADGQLAMVNTGETGAGAGNALTGLHFWGQGFGGWADQGVRKGFDGYDADVHGLAMGVDTRNFDRDTVVGLSIGAARTNVQSKNANRTQTDVEGYQLMLYGNHELGDHVFVTGMALYGWNGNEQSRFNVGGVPGLTADAEYDSWVGGLRSSIGRNYILSPGAMHADAFQITPQLFSEFVRFTRDGYDETGAGGANLSVGDARQTIWNFGISVQAEWTYIMEGGGKLKPDVHVSYKYDVMDDRADTTASFFAGGSTFESQGVDPANSVFGIGVGVKFYDTSGWDFTANYDFTFKDAYEAHSAFVRAAYEF